MKRIALCKLLTLALFAASIPSSVAHYQVTDQQTTYASTHTDNEVATYAQMRLDQLTSQALDDPNSSSTSLLNTPEGFPTSSSDLYYMGDPSEYGTSEFQFCMSTRTEECRRQYNGELFASAAVSATVFAGCVGLTVGTALIACAAAALAAHTLNIVAAQQRYQGCLARTYSDCALAYGRK
jgi:superfamily I DNA and RNA helicase